MWILFLLLMTGIAQAKVYVITAPDSSVYSVSEQDDAVIPKGYSKNIINGNISNLPISGEPSLYNFNKGAFTLNSGKVQARIIEQQKQIMLEADHQDKKGSAIVKLRGLGLTDDEIKAIENE